MGPYRRRGSGRRLVRFAKRRCSAATFSVSLLSLVCLSFFALNSPFLGLHHGQDNQGTSAIEIVKSKWRYAHDHLPSNIYSSSEVKDSHSGTEKDLHSSTTFPELNLHYNNERNASDGRADGDTSTVMIVNQNKWEKGLPKPSKSKSRKRHVPCEVDFKETVDDFMEPESYMNYTIFSLNYVVKEEKPIENILFEPQFGGHQTLEERENSYYARDQTLHCGFVKGPEGYPSSGFDLNERDKEYMATCRVAVSSCIFGSSDFLRRPTSRMTD